MAHDSFAERSSPGRRLEAGSGRSAVSTRDDCGLPGGPAQPGSGTLTAGGGVDERHRTGRAGGGPAGEPARGLAGTGLVADDVFLLGHDDRSGRPLLQPRALGIGLAGGLLAELMLAGLIGLRPDGAVVINPD